MAKPKTRGNGEGTIYKGKKYWVAQITVGRDFKTGKLKRKSFYAKTKKEVAEKMIKARYELNNGCYIEPSSITVDRWAMYWLDNFKKPEIQDSTYERYKNLVETRIAKPFYNIKLKDLTAFMIQEYINSLCEENLRQRYIKNICKKLSAILNKAEELELIKKNPCKNMVIPKLDNSKAMNVFTRQEQERFVKICFEKFEYGRIFIFLIGTGCRVGEALALTWDDIDFNYDFISINKTAAEVYGDSVIHKKTKTASGRRKLPISPTIKDILERIKKEDDKNKNKLRLVFTSCDYKIIKASLLRSKIKEYCEFAGVSRINIHALRHTFATRAIEQDINVKVLSEILGHKDISVTLNTYAHILDEVKKEKLLKIDIFKKTDSF